jgi:hypothetical protein
MLGCRVLKIAINDLEGARERHAQPAHNRRQLIFGIFVIIELKRRLGGKMLEDRP